VLTRAGVADKKSAGIDEIREYAIKKSKQVLASLGVPLRIAGQEFRLSANLGISIFPTDSDRSEPMLTNASSAASQAKSLRSGFSLYTPDLSRRLLDRNALETRLHRAINQQEFVLHYQPIINLKNGRMVGVEALIRWQTYSSDLIMPSEFIPVAEESGMISLIGEWVLNTVCQQARAWRDQGYKLYIAFNFSLREIWQDNVADKILQAVKASGIDIDALELEITESTAMSDTSRTEHIFEDLSSQGLRLSIDDFGTGHSSLDRLRRLPVHTLKIDRSFMDGIPAREDNQAFVQTMINLAENLGKTPLAEGIEVEEQLHFLVKHGCSLGQGYYFSRPCPADAISNMLKNETTWEMPRYHSCIASQRSASSAAMHPVPAADTACR